MIQPIRQLIYQHVKAEQDKEKPSKAPSHATGPAPDVAAAMNTAFAINEQGGRLDPGDTSGKVPTECRAYLLT